jgi:hypothetical protein
MNDDFRVPDFVPEDFGPVGPVPRPEPRSFFGDFEDVQQHAEQALAEAVHRLRASPHTFVLITPIPEEHDGGFAAEIVVSGSLEERMRAYKGMAYAAHDAMRRLAEAFVDDLAEVLPEWPGGGDE